MPCNRRGGCPVVAVAGAGGGRGGRAGHCGVVPQSGAWADSLSLPALLGTTTRTIPGAAGYLTADERLAGLWRFGLPEGFKVGLCWAASTHHATPWWRSIPPAALAPLLKVPGVSFVNLQVGPNNADGDAMGITTNPAATLRDYEQTAAVLANLNLVISVDTSVAHLAGGMGMPVFIMLPRPSDWRWLEGREDSPWYASARLFRQTRPIDWSDPVAEAAKALRKVVRVAGRRAAA